MSNEEFHNKFVLPGISVESYRKFLENKIEALEKKKSCLKPLIGIYTKGRDNSKDFNKLAADALQRDIDYFSDKLEKLKKEHSWD